MIEIEEQTILKSNEILLKKAQIIFGKDAVQKAYITTYFFPDSGADSKEQMRERLKQCRVNFDNDFKRIDYDTETIILIFTNGHIVEFTNSEWATISLIEPHKFVEYHIEKEEKETQLTLPRKEDCNEYL